MEFYTYMKKLKFVDLNHSLVEKVKDIGVEAECGDYFMTALSIPRHVLMTASNPNYTFGGGLDFYFRKHFPLYCEQKQFKKTGMERIGNIVFAETVDENLKATKEQVKKAVQFALDNTYEGETLVLSGVGTGIGCMSEDKFVEILEEIT